MAQVVGKDGNPCLLPEDTTDELLKRCKYAVMDEDKLVVEAIPTSQVAIGLRKITTTLPPSAKSGCSRRLTLSLLLTEGSG